MRIAFFGGTFDPPHRGHVAISRAAADRLELDRVLLAPVAVQPLRNKAPQASFADRLAMVELAVAGEPRLMASTLDGPRPDGLPNYTIDSLAALRSSLGPDDELFCLVGADSLLSLKHWRCASELLILAGFIVAGRPGFSLAEAIEALPPGLMVVGEEHRPQWTRLDLAPGSPKELSATASPAAGDCGTPTRLSGSPLRRSALYLLPDLHEDISATAIRAALAGGEEAGSILDPRVAGYIRSHRLYPLIEAAEDGNL